MSSEEEEEEEGHRVVYRVRGTSARAVAQSSRRLSTGPLEVGYSSSGWLRSKGGVVARFAAASRLRPR
jgi:hypothetical protein